MGDAYLSEIANLPRSQSLLTPLSLRSKAALSDGTRTPESDFEYDSQFWERFGAINNSILLFPLSISNLDLHSIVLRASRCFLS